MKRRNKTEFSNILASKEPCGWEADNMTLLNTNELLEVGPRCKELVLSTMTSFS